MKGIHRKRFRGTIASIDRPDLELEIELWVDERGVTVARHDKPLATWPIGLVEIDRVGSARFVITLNGEHSAFIAQDPIAFSYEGLKAIDSAKQKNGKRRRRRSKENPPSLKAILVARSHGTTGPTTVAEPATTSGAEPTVEPEPERPRHSHITKPKPKAPAAPPPAPAPDPYEPPPTAMVPEEEQEMAVMAPGVRRHPGVLDRVRNARNGIVHEHVYTEHGATGGLKRRVCNECGHVSIDLSE